MESGGLNSPMLTHKVNLTVLVLVDCLSCFIIGLCVYLGVYACTTLPYTTYYTPMGDHLYISSEQVGLYTNICIPDFKLNREWAYNVLGLIIRNLQYM